MCTSTLVILSLESILFASITSIIFFFFCESNLDCTSAALVVLFFDFEIDCAFCFFFLVSFSFTFSSGDGGSESHPHSPNLLIRK